MSVFSVNHWPLLAAVACGGSLGALLRYSLVSAISARFAHPFPWGTLSVNLSGSFLAGCVIGALAAKLPPNHWLFVLLFNGVLSAMTTFSAFAIETITLFEKGEILKAGAYIAASVLLALLSAGLGLVLARTLIA